jgi:alpha-L-fucosidase
MRLLARGGREAPAEGAQEKEMTPTDRILQDADQTIAAGPFSPSWRSLENYRIPAWYKDAKFGIFIHWGVYAVPAFGSEWYPRLMYSKDGPEKWYDAFSHHVQYYGPQSHFGYKDFIPDFKAERFDPTAWADLFAEAGAKFIMPVAEHHDGFAMYDCSLTRWKASAMGPRRDVIGELAAAVREKGMTFACSSHRAENWWFFNGGREIESDVNDPDLADLYGRAMPKATPPDKAFLDDWLARTCELVTKYEPRIVWFDWCIETPAFEPYLKRFAAFYYNYAATKGIEVAINYKYQAFPPEAAVFDIERGQVAGISPRLWQNDTSVSKNSWGYIKNQEYKEPLGIIQDLIDIVSKNGALLLNIGPKPDGAIPDHEQQMLRTIGRWLAKNGEAIYSTRPWKLFGEGPTQIAEGAFADTKRAGFTPQDIRFTSRDDVIYAFALAMPPDGKLRITSLGTEKVQAPLNIRAVKSMEGKPLRWTRDAKALAVELDDSQRGEDIAVIQIER